MFARQAVEVDNRSAHDLIYSGFEDRAVSYEYWG